MTQLEKLAHQNKSIIAKMILKLDFNQIFFLILNIMLRITKKLFDVLVLDLD